MKMPLGAVVGLEHLQAIDEIRATDRIAADAGAGAGPQVPLS
ncbi:hypothetical protein [Cupriavidus sp. CuC1]